MKENIQQGNALDAPIVAPEISTFKTRRIDSRKGAKIAKMDENRIGKEIVDAAIPAELR